MASAWSVRWSSPASPAAWVITNWNHLAGRRQFVVDHRHDRKRAGSRSARQRYAHAVPETSYASCGDLSLAYQVFGDGPVELVVVMPFVSHIELAWTLPQFKAFAEQLATFCRVALFETAGGR